MSGSQIQEAHQMEAFLLTVTAIGHSNLVRVQNGIHMFLISPEERKAEYINRWNKAGERSYRRHRHLYSAKLHTLNDISLVAKLVIRIYFYFNFAIGALFHNLFKILRCFYRRFGCCL